MSIDRIDANGNYSKENCRWADVETQSYNKRSTRYLEISGERLNVICASRKYGVPVKTIRSRLAEGKSGEDLVKVGVQLQIGSEKPASKLNDKKVMDIKERIFRGEKIKDIAAIYGVSGPTISHIKCGKVWKHIGLAVA